MSELSEGKLHYRAMCHVLTVGEPAMYSTCMCILSMQMLLCMYILQNSGSGGRAVGSSLYVLTLKTPWQCSGFNHGCEVSD